MRLEGSCHCGAVKFSLDSHTPYPYMRCYCSICRKTAGGGGYAINIMGETKSLQAQGREERERLPRAHQDEKTGETEALRARAGTSATSAAARSGSWDPRWTRVGVPVRLGDRHATAQADRGGRDHARFRGAVGRDPERRGAYAFRSVSRGRHRRLAPQAAARGALTRHGLVARTRASRSCVAPRIARN